MLRIHESATTIRINLFYFRPFIQNICKNLFVLHRILWFEKINEQLLQFSTLVLCHSHVQ